MQSLIVPYTHFWSLNILRDDRDAVDFWHPLLYNVMKFDDEWNSRSAPALSSHWSASYLDAVGIRLKWADVNKSLWRCNEY